METKQFKKLVINKETISALNDYALLQHKGGRSDFITCVTYNDCPQYSETCLWKTECITDTLWPKC